MRTKRTQNKKTKIESEPTLVMHIRRCHHCDHVSEAQSSAIMRCQSCGKHLAPFYFFDESSLEGLEEGELYQSTLREAKKILPIWGISLYWSE